MSHGKRILIIEDNPDLAAALCDALSEAGFEATSVATGEEGLELIKKDNPTLLLLDSILPQMSGMDVLKALQEYRKMHELKIIMLSNVDDPHELRAAREFDIEEYLIKTDWRMEDVIKTIKNHI
jgi:DNA-binding response OmpR family regulator